VRRRKRRLFQAYLVMGEKNCKEPGESPIYVGMRCELEVEFVTKELAGEGVKSAQSLAVGGVKLRPRYAAPESGDHSLF
jgi:hypothetical protein